jgi:hypothetical protein
MYKRTLSALLFLLALSACTANVEDPVVNQQGREGDETCVESCDETQITCSGKCDDDGCRGKCKTEFDDCSVECTSTTDDES